MMAVPLCLLGEAAERLWSVLSSPVDGPLRVTCTQVKLQAPLRQPEHQIWTKILPLQLGSFLLGLLQVKRKHEKKAVSSCLSPAVSKSEM